MAETTNRQEANKAIVERWHEALVTGNGDDLEELLGDDVVIHRPDLPEPLRGRDAAAEMVEAGAQSTPDQRTTIDTIVAEDDDVAVHFTWQGTYQGPEMADEGKAFECIGTEFVRIEDGRLVESRFLWDNLSFMQQLGVIAEDAVAGGG